MTASKLTFARSINRMDDDDVQVALMMVYTHVQNECRDGVLVQFEYRDSDEPTSDGGTKEKMDSCSQKHLACVY